MFVIQSLSLRPRAFFFVFPRHPPTQQLCHFPFSMLRCGCPHYSLQLLTTDPDIYIRHLSLRGKAKAEQGESILGGEKDKGAKSWGQLVHYYHPVLRGLPANGQELILCLGPQPGSLATITCDNRRMSLSFARRPPRRCANRGRLSQFGSKSR